jgi:hypothetical protein
VQLDRLLYDAWWLDDRYRYGEVPFLPRRMSPKQLATGCIEARRRFYRWRSILRRAFHRVNWRSPRMLANYFLINAMHQGDIEGRNGLPLGDQQFRGPLLESNCSSPLIVGGANQ